MLWSELRHGTYPMNVTHVSKKEFQYVSPYCVLEHDGSFPHFTYQRIWLQSCILHFSKPSICRSAEYKKYRVLVPTTERFFFPCYKEECSPAIRTVSIVTHVATVSVTSTREAITLQELVVRFARKRREMAAWGYRISEKLVGTSVVTETSSFHIWRSWKRFFFWLITITLWTPQAIQRRMLVWFVSGDLESIGENLRGWWTASRLSA